MPTAVSPSFAIECGCGTWARGNRQPHPQALTCAGCGKPVFVFPVAATMFGQAVPMTGAGWRARLRFWLPPAAAAVLALAVVGVVIAAIVRGHRPTADAVGGPDGFDAHARVLLGDRLTAAR